jgi:hypothetical protein
MLENYLVFYKISFPYPEQFAGSSGCFAYDVLPARAGKYIVFTGPVNAAEVLHHP